MLGVIAPPMEEAAVREFFELFKTPWEFYRAGQSYSVVICSGASNLKDVQARLVIIYSSERVGIDTAENLQIQTERQGALVSFVSSEFPIYGKVLTFRCQEGGPLHESRSHETVCCRRVQASRTLARVGYDLFREIETILVKGQPPENASIPALDLHIEFLRTLIRQAGIAFVEVPPIPDGYSFIACLTHDLDHASIRRHKFDSTMFGFVYRATVGSALKFVRGRLPLRKLLRNWSAAAKLPLIHLGLARDFWYEFDRYLQIEQGRPSTFFVIPFAHFPGRSTHGNAPNARGAGYDISNIREKVPKLVNAGCEVGLHGIDAWVDSARGRIEAARISEISEKNHIGVRMHWLYHNEQSPATLEAANFEYDSTIGFNEAVGYRAGTVQVFKPLSAKRLLELPLHVMDTALFYSGRLNLSEADAWQQVQAIVDNATSAGGVLTVNWHDRSIAPERLWGDFYIRLLNEMTRRKSCFLTASQTVAWFRKRRSVIFQRAAANGQVIRASITGENSESLPPLRLRSHKADTASEGQSSVDQLFSETIEFPCPN